MPASLCSQLLVFRQDRWQEITCLFGDSIVGLEVSKVISGKYYSSVSIQIPTNKKSFTRGNKYKLDKVSFWLDFRKYSFSSRIVNIWNNLPSQLVDVNSIHLFKARLDKFWSCQDVMFDWMANLARIGDKTQCKNHTNKSSGRGLKNIIFIVAVQLWFWAHFRQRIAAAIIDVAKPIWSGTSGHRLKAIHQYMALMWQRRPQMKISHCGIVAISH